MPCLCQKDVTYWVSFPLSSTKKRKTKKGENNHSSSMPFSLLKANYDFRCSLVVVIIVIVANLFFWCTFPSVLHCSYLRISFFSLLWCLQRHTHKHTLTHTSSRADYLQFLFLLIQCIRFTLSVVRSLSIVI